MLSSDPIGQTTPSRGCKGWSITLSVPVYLGMPSYVVSIFLFLRLFSSNIYQRELMNQTLPNGNIDQVGENRQYFSIIKSNIWSNERLISFAFKILLSFNCHFLCFIEDLSWLITIFSFGGDTNLMTTKLWHRFHLQAICAGDRISCFCTLWCLWNASIPFIVFFSKIFHVFRLQWMEFCFHH